MNDTKVFFGNSELILGHPLWNKGLVFVSNDNKGSMRCLFQSNMSAIR